MIAVDTNILVYAHVPADPHHQRALAWLEHLGARPGPWGIPLPCIAEFVRIASHPRMLARGLEEVIGAVEVLLETSNASLLVPSQGVWPRYADTLRDGKARGNLAFDALIATTCREHGALALLTEDRDFARFSWLRTIRLEDNEAIW